MSDEKEGRSLGGIYALPLSHLMLPMEDFVVDLRRRTGLIALERSVEMGTPTPSTIALALLLEINRVTRKKK